MKRDLDNVFRVLLGIALGTLVCWLLSGCSPRVVEIEKPVIVEQTHTQTRVDIVRDTLVWRDSIYHFVKGDTVVIERWHTVKDVVRVAVADTVRDTVPRVVTVTRTEVVEVNKVKMWQRALMWAGGIGIAVTAMLVAARIRKFK